MAKGESSRASPAESILILVLSCGSLAVYLLANPAFHREGGRLLDNLRKLGERFIW